MSYVIQTREAMQFTHVKFFDMTFEIIDFDIFVINDSQETRNLLKYRKNCLKQNSTSIYCGRDYALLCC